MWYYRGLSSPTQTDDEDMDVDSVAADTVLDIPNNTASIINNLLSKDITDVFATEAMQKMEFAQVLVSFVIIHKVVYDTKCVLCVWSYRYKYNQTCFSITIKLSSWSQANISAAIITKL